MALPAALFDEKEKCVTDHLAAIEVYESWLEATFPDDSDVVGKSRGPLSCPLHNFLADVCGVNADVDMSAVKVATTRRIGDDRVPIVVKPHVWVKGFIRRVDRFGNGHRITKAEAKEAIAHVREMIAKPLSQYDDEYWIYKGTG